MSNKVLLLIGCILFVLPACTNNQAVNQEKEKYERLSHQQTDNPQQMNQVGESWGLRLDKEKVYETVALIDGVEVRRVNFTGSKAYVAVRATNEDIDEEERNRLEQQTKAALEEALPRYRLQVNIK
ncbi:hypothetical protein [Pontibacillus litoralis]|uniref:Sporulation protein n=1 Tax=Pontibacillus litoralis JSM 072002 TaxID=1385512 RepID=A0A0A5G056_9BACI|nr:hypothetical protein [Pontibacillus litoralis]KGX86461.1 hypothetical protein N784_04720 [Pontibacillus litoralis JSM 072002]